MSLLVLSLMLGITVPFYCFNLSACEEPRETLRGWKPARPSAPPCGYLLTML